MDDRTVYPQAARNLGLRQAFGMGQQQGFHLQQAVGFVFSA